MTRNRPSEEVMTVINLYRPRIAAPVWSEVADFTRHVVTTAHPPTAQMARDWLIATGQFAAWAHRTAGLEISIEQVMHQATIDRYAATELRRYTPSTQSRRARTLGELARIVTGGDRPYTRIKYAHSLAKPYTPADEVMLRNWPNRQSTGGRRRNAHGILGLCRGAGLRSREVELVRVGDVKLERSGATVQVRGPQARLVPVNPAWLNHLEIVMASAGDAKDFLLAPGSRAARRSLVSEVTSRQYVQGARTYRMRSAWIIEWIHTAPAARVLEVAGLADFHALNRHLPYLDLVPAPAAGVGGA